MQKILNALASASLLSLSLVPANAAGGLGVGDLNIAAVYSLDRCQSDLELDCLESVGIVDSEGSYIDASYISGNLENTFSDSQGNKIYSGRTVWQANQKTISIVAQLDTPNHIIDKFRSGETHYGAALRIFISVENPLTTKVRVKLRTSWLKPQSVQVKQFESSYKDELIPGGHRWTFEGMGLKHSSFNGAGPKAAEARADYDGVLFDIFLHHAGVDSNHSFFPPICADKGYTVQSNNTNATGEPMWDRGSDSLIFGVSAPHFTTAGELNLGYFKFWTTDEFLNCKFPTNSLTKSPNLVLQIINEDGTEAVATTQVSHSNGKIFLLAAGFHFSSPKIILKADKAVVLAPIPSTAPTSGPVTKAQSAKPAKKITIKCQKGKLFRQVTSTSPKCPTGYKKVK